MDHGEAGAATRAVETFGQKADRATPSQISRFGLVPFRFGSDDRMLCNARHVVALAQRNDDAGEAAAEAAVQRNKICALQGRAWVAYSIKSAKGPRPLGDSVKGAHDRGYVIARLLQIIDKPVGLPDAFVEQGQNCAHCVVVQHNVCLAHLGSALGSILHR